MTALSCFEKSSVARHAEQILLVIISIIAGIALVELLCHLFLPSINSARVYDWNRRIMFFDGSGTIFQNHEDIFTYVPNNEIRSLTVYFSDRDFVTEYDYRFRTNNFGLVQDSDVIPSRPSLLILGDSFAEGQGAEPWFRQLGPHIDGLQYQVLNGGLIGTGFEQWHKLEQYLSAEDVQIRKLVVLFISDDYGRGVWNFSTPALRCLTTLASCRGDESIYFRLPPAAELRSWVDKIRTIRAPERLTDRLRQGARRLLPASHHVYDYLHSKLERSRARELAEQRSRAAIVELIERYGTENVAFVHLPQKDEISGPNEPGLKARRSIQDARGHLFDGFKLCGLTSADYHVHDGHPNKQGYGKIARCVGRVIQLMATAAR
jgi:hypothetical protein